MTVDEHAAAANRQRDAFVRVVRVVAFFEGRPPSRPLAREARAFVALRCAPTRAAGPTMSTFVREVVEKRATRTRASGRLSGCASRYAANTVRIARSVFAWLSAAAWIGSPGT